MIGPCRSDGPLADDSAGVANWRNTLTGHGNSPSAAGPSHQQESFTCEDFPSGLDSQTTASDGHRRDWRLPLTERSVTVLRRRLTNFLDGAELSADDRYDLLLAVCEAASNAIEHARDPSEPFIDVLSEISDGRVTVVVRDHGQWSSVASGSHRGRGLQMMWLLADTTLVPSPRGTTVTIRSSPRRRSPVARHDERLAADGSAFPSSAVGGV